MENHNIRADFSLEVNSFLSVNGYIYGESISLSHISITDIRQIETMFTEITLNLALPLRRNIFTISLKQKSISRRPYLFDSLMKQDPIVPICQNYNLFLAN